MAESKGVSAANEDLTAENGVGYRVQVRTFADEDGDHLGDMAGLLSHLGYLELLGATQLAADAYTPELAAAARSHHLELAQPPEDLLLAQVSFDAAAIQQAITLGAATAHPEWSIGRPGDAAPATRLRPAGGSPGGMTDAGRAAAMALLLVALALPGTVWLNQGDEVALPDTPEGPHLLPWEDAGGYGFTLDAELDDADSWLNLTRLAINTRQTSRACTGQMLAWYGAPEDCLAFRRDPGGLICALNTGSTQIDAPPGDLLLASAPAPPGFLAPYSAAWLTMR